MHRKKYILDVLKRFNMWGCNPIETPAEVNLKFAKGENEASVDGTLFRQIVGSLRFICHSRREITFNVGLVSRFMSDPRQSHLLAAKRIMSSKKQLVVALSTCETKYIASCSAACQALWHSSLINELKVSSDEAVELIVDNKSAIDLAKNPISHGRSKHIDTKFHFLKDQVSKGIVKLRNCRSKVQLADIMTKSFKAERFKVLRKLQNVVYF
ncbi:hypothetical protein JHK87_049851 [Glycine soja]|nr:hypothetical protein JHK87_049851 [Glycine soja]